MKKGEVKNSKSVYRKFRSPKHVFHKKPYVAVSEATVSNM